MKKLFVSVLGLLASMGAVAQPDDLNCYTVIAGKDATVDGSVMMAHNEDDGGEQLLNYYMVPSQSYQKGDVYQLRNGGKESQVSVTNKYLWIELPGMDVADSFLNDKGVAVVSNACPSREDKEDYTDGGILYDLRRLVAERATSAKDAVRLIGRLVDKYGYASSGRSYCVADANEGWIVSIVQGKHWVAARIPDDMVMVIPNYYVINEVNLTDTVNFMGSPDIIDYAVKRGWYNPKKDGDFNFAKVYSKEDAYNNSRNIDRKWRGLTKLASGDFDSENYEAFPFTVKPKQKVTLNTLMNLLSDHYEGTEIDCVRKSEDGNPHTAYWRTICTNTTQYAVVFQLRKDMPVEIGALAWIAPYHPCTQVFVPWYIGIETLPEGYSRYVSYQEAQEKHFTDTTGYREKYPTHKYWEAVKVADRADKQYSIFIEPIKSKNLMKQYELIKAQPAFEQEMINLLAQDKAKCVQALTDYTQKVLSE